MKKLVEIEHRIESAFFFYENDTRKLMIQDGTIIENNKLQK